MDLHSTSDLRFAKAELEHRYGLGRHGRKGPAPSEEVVLRVRARERAWLSGRRRNRAA